MNLTAVAQAVACSTLLAVEPPAAPFAFRLRLPGHWQHLPAPAERTAFADPRAWDSAAVFLAPSDAVVFAVECRPCAAAPGELRATLHELCAVRGWRVQQLGSAPIAGRTAAVCSAAQETAGGWQRLKIALLVGAGRFVTLTASAPESLWPAARGAFDTLFGSFVLVET